MRPSSLYIHIPFCSSLCAYCDFTKILYLPKYVNDYMRCLEEEIKQLHPAHLTSIYIGGGTPSVLSEEEILPLLTFLKSRLAPEYEYTLEMNVEHINEQKLRLYRAMGINRLSIGVQSFDDAVITAMHRHHNAKMIKDNIALVKKVGFKNISIDLIYGLPNQSLSVWKKDVAAALSLDVDHLSAYSLSIGPACRFYVEGQKELSADQSRVYYDYLLATLRNHGYERYEVSNFARNKAYSKHNLVYWKSDEYFGCGLGASGYYDGFRYENTKNMLTYLQKGPCPLKEYLDEKMRLEEYLLLNLRTMWGLHLVTLKKIAPAQFPRLERQIHEFLDSGLLKKNEQQIFCSDDGFMLLDYILTHLF